MRGPGAQPAANSIWAMGRVGFAVEMSENEMPSRAFVRMPRGNTDLDWILSDVIDLLRKNSPMNV